MSSTTQELLRLKIAKDSIIINIASICSQILIFIQTVLVMRILNPEYYGIWIGINMLFAYSGFANLGLEYVFSIRYPYYQGKKDQEKCASIADTVYFVWTLTAILYMLGVLLYAFIFPQTSKIVFWGLVAVSILIIFEQQTTFFNRWISAGEKNFSYPSYISILKNATSFLIIIPFVYLWGINGLMIGSVLISFMVLIFWSIKTSFKFRWKPSITTFKEMMSVGITGFMVSVFNTFVKSVDRLLIITFLGVAGLGYYSVVAMGGSFLYMLLAQASSALLPHMVEHIGENNDSAQSLEKYLIKPTIIFSYMSSIFLIILFFTLPLLVEIMLPKYIPGLYAFYVFLPSFFFLSIVLTSNNILYLILIPKGRQRYILYVQVFTAVIQIGLSLLFINFEWGIVGIAFAATLANAFWGFTILFLSIKYIIEGNKKRFILLKNIFKPLLYVLLSLSTVYWIETQWNHLNVFVLASIKLFLCFILTTPLLYFMNKHTEIKSLVLPFMCSLKNRVHFLRTIKTEI
jgi:O-antigen/teichoic acid export membrane protein